ncbi:restriction endonuclease subunit S [Jeotgalicoccus meleagridis]|uniref:Type I restriction modification DNA specificity domain-containing protein n=1 Tax=Jeotgalicoccus meleagridis TaxID=2759181 RepID=A0A6V7R3L0_9STAP|nr:restriction endonuclease subunit S [Jeotgalicoccus meleagridis]CAD2071655.1 hypothetical protein JEODO184_00339 [Jeotgalicoccus meleagridis]
MEYNLEDLIKSVSVKHNFPNDQIIFLNTSDIEDGTVLNHSYSDVKTLPGQAKKSIMRNDILYSEIRPKNKRFAFIDYDPEEYVVSTKLMVLRVNDTAQLHPKYLYYYLTNKPIINHLQNLAESRSGTFPQITFNELKKLKVNLPTIEKQHKIISFMDSINGLITNNNQSIANLEELSQTLFKRWFVDFEFPDENRNPYKSYEGEFQYLKNRKLPLSWTINTIADNASGGIITGKTPSTKIKENYAPHGIPFITIPDMHKDVFVLNTERYISELGMSKLKNKILPKNSISVSCIATPGLVTITSKDSITNQQVNSFQPNKNKLYYLYFTLKRMKGYIRDLGSGGSATLNLNKSQFSKIEVVSPTDDILDNFNKLIEPNFHKILNLQKENMNLSHLRDTLLPKLMSGEIELPDELEVDEHAELLQ